METSLSNTELNELVARKLAWVQCCNPGTIENGKIIDCFGWSKGGSHFHEALPAYSTSIEAAFECLGDREWRLERLKVRPADKETTTAFWCSVGVDLDKWIHVQADTAPMAIVKAFLKLP